MEHSILNAAKTTLQEATDEMDRNGQELQKTLNEDANRAVVDDPIPPSVEDIDLSNLPGGPDDNTLPKEVKLNPQAATFISNQQVPPPTLEDTDDSDQTSDILGGIAPLDPIDRDEQSNGNPEIPSSNGNTLDDELGLKNLLDTAPHANKQRSEDNDGGSTLAEEEGHFVYVTNTKDAEMVTAVLEPIGYTPIINYDMCKIHQRLVKIEDRLSSFGMSDFQEAVDAVTKNYQKQMNDSWDILTKDRDAIIKGFESHLVDMHTAHKMDMATLKSSIQKIDENMLKITHAWGVVTNDYKAILSKLHAIPTDYIHAPSASYSTGLNTTATPESAFDDTALKIEINTQFRNGFPSLLQVGEWMEIKKEWITELHARLVPSVFSEVEFVYLCVLYRVYLNPEKLPEVWHCYQDIMECMKAGPDSLRGLINEMKRIKMFTKGGKEIKKPPKAQLPTPPTGDSGDVFQMMSKYFKR